MNLHSDYPFWMVKEGVINSFPSLQDNHKTGVVIIGGGITGALIAHRIAAAGLRVTVVDKRHVAHGSTSASTSMLQYEVDVPLFKLIEMVGQKRAARAYQLCSEAIDEIGRIASPYPKAADFKKYPSLMYASFEKHVPQILQPEYKARLKHGFDMEWLDADSLTKQFGFAAPAAILSKQGGQVNPYKLCHYLLGDLLRQGHHVFDLTEVTGWDTDSKGVLLHTREGYEIEAKHVVVACGYETQQYVPKKVTDFNSSYAIVSKPIARRQFWAHNALIWETKTPYLYMRTTGDNRILVGGRDEVSPNPQKRDSLIPQKRVQLEADFRRLFPDIPFQTDFAWAGTFAETKDGLPYLGSYDDPRVHFAMGYGGNGIVFSVVGAQIICDAVQGKKNADASIFRFDR
ncbi:MAG TPA: FAD-dependent oxidoreductase [Saprospiraceae bacterium]|nr:FAD-dependent oxidoreductase [Saprospiraceae bacterium]HND88562.1 FAD-dependent oxidoreductase [Saprospiraceae bacterium]HNG89228.1 FAD-dependent oxidoreductase [Saprospiraceae bacterium]